MSRHSQHLEQLKNWDLLIRQGKVQDVRRETLKINANQIPRELRVEYAQVARRIGSPELMIRWLRSIVRSEKLSRQEPSDLEKALYAGGLVRLGAFREAEEIFSEISSQEFPDILFLKSSFFINQWQYKQAETELRRHIRHPKTLPYAKLVSRLNLCSALLAQSRLDDAHSEIKSLMDDLGGDENRLLRGNLLEIRSQLNDARKDYTAALADLDMAAALLRRADERSQLYVTKWRSLILLHQEGNNLDVPKKLDELKNWAERIRDWETVRECDLHRALLTRDRDYFLKAYWGSLFPAYKKRVREQFDPTIEVGQSYLWSCGSAPFTGTPFDLVDKAPTPALKRLLFILTREFYRPLRVTEVSDLLFVNEYYNPATTPGKLHRIVSRCRQWLLQSKLPFSILAKNGELKLESTLSCQLILKAKLSTEAPTKIPSELMDRPFFSVQDWAQSENISTSTALRRIQKLIKTKKVTTLHSGRGAKYKVISGGK